MTDESRLARAIATAVIGVDTLWGGDVLDPSGAGRFIADSWFSDLPLPEAYHHPAAARLRETGGVGSPSVDPAAVDAYLAAVDVERAVEELDAAARDRGGLRGDYLAGEASCLRTMLELAREVLGRGPPVPYERCVRDACGVAPSPSRPAERRAQVAELLARAGHPSRDRDGLLAAVDAWRAERRVPRRSIPMIADAIIARLEDGTRRHLLPHLPGPLREVPLARVTFLPLEGAFFSGSMNYLGRSREADGSPRYDATYELNVELEIAVPEFVDLVAHEVVPGHVTTFALLQGLHVQGRAGFEATVATMNTRAATLYEGIANNALLLSLGVTSIDALPDPDLRLGSLLARLQDDAKNQASWLTWEEHRPQAEVARVLRRDYLVSEERAGKLSGAWARHPLLGRMSLPAYRAGTEKVAELLLRHPPARLVPALYGVNGLVDVVTVEQAVG